MAENQGLYRYTNLNNNDVYFSSNIQRLVQNYRSGFLQLALEDLYSSDENGKTRSLSLLHNMDDYFPPNIIPVSEPELDIQIGRIYTQAGEPEELRKRLKVLESREGMDLETYFYIAQVYVNELNSTEDAIRLYSNMKLDYPYISDIRLALVQIYSQSEEYEKAIQELEEWLMVSPNEEQAIELLKYLKAQA
jgi:tetratricopeptide (TPR) repeat protein